MVVEEAGEGKGWGVWEVEGVEVRMEEGMEGEGDVVEGLTWCSCCSLASTSARRGAGSGVVGGRPEEAEGEVEGGGC